MAQQLVKQESQNDVATAERIQGGPTFVPRFDILETEDELTLFGDLPGVRSEDLDIRFENNQLIVHGKVAPRHENREFLYGEYGIGDFYRVFNIGESIDSGKISAELKNGTLALHLPKAEAVKPRKIAVKAG
jgi:HSP20 family molecular chaperone IbpA